MRSPLADVLSALHSGLQGLPETVALERHGVYGPNVLGPRAERAVILEFLAHLKNPLVVVLLTAATISAFLDDIRSFIVITLIVMLSVLLDFVQEYRAGKAAERLRNSVAVCASVLRDGQPREVTISELVPGDIVLLSAGDLVPADGRVVEARDFFVNQAMLTGESYPVEKHASESDTTTDLQAATNVVLMGTSVVSGSAKVVIVNTGQCTALAKISDTLAMRPPATAFERGTQAFGMLILRLTMLLVLFVLLVNAAFDRIRPLHQLGSKEQAIVVSNPYGSVDIGQPGYGTEIPDAASPPSPPRRMQLRAVDNLIRSLSNVQRLQMPRLPR